MKKNKSKMDPVTVIMILIILVIGMVCMYSVTFAEDNPWTQKTDMSTGRHSFAASVVNDKIYAIGGRYTDDLVTEYDPATDTWTTKTPMPTSRMLPVSGMVAEKIYVIGGLVTAFAPALSTVEEYDPATDTWIVKDDMLTQRLGHSVSVVDGKIYVMGGMVSGSNFWSGIQSSVEVYDPLTDTWNTKSNIPTPRVWLSTSVVDGKIYAIGGLLVTKEVLSLVEVYDPATDTWSTKTPMPTARGAHAATVVDGIIYVIGGGTENGQPVGGYSVVEAYDPVTDTWTKKTDIPEPRASFSASTVDGNIYAIGGISTFANPHLHGEKTVYAYDPAQDLASLFDQLSINKCFAQAGSDSICITVKMNDTAGVTLFAEIESPDQTPVDSLELFDDGNHNDGNAGDSLYANIWPINLTEEQDYYVDLEVTQVNAETIVHHMDNMAVFTTIGPIVYDGYTLKSTDTEPNPGDAIDIKVTLKNESTTTTATDIKAKLSSLNGFANVTTDIYRTFKNIEAGASKTSLSYFNLEISEDCPDNTEIQFVLDITSHDYSFWSDTFSILVMNPSTDINIRENIPSHFSLDQNYPNPFNPVTTIHYSLPVRDKVTLKVYNSLGKEIRTLVNEPMDAGNHSVTFDASHLSSGLFFYELQAHDIIKTRKMLLIK